MSARVDAILDLLRNQFSTLSLSANAGQNPRAIEQKIADAVFNSLQSYDRADAFELEQNDEVFECKYPQDEDSVPVYDGGDEVHKFVRHLQQVRKIRQRLDADMVPNNLQRNPGPYAHGQMRSLSRFLGWSEGSQLLPTGWKRNQHQDLSAGDHIADSAT